VKLETFTLAAASALLLLSTANLLSVSAVENTSESDLAKTEVKWTPVIMRPTVNPQLFQGSDNKWNLVYEVLLQNTTKFPATISSFSLIDSATGKTVREYANKSLAAILTQPSGNKTLTIAPGATATIWVNVFLDKPDEVSKELAHHIELSTKSIFDGKKVDYKYNGAQIHVNTDAPLVVSPPLRGGDWVAIGGYCGVVGHRRTLLPTENKYACAQRYAIDWVRIDAADKKTVSGDPAKPESNKAYDQPIYAVADGTVIAAVDKFDNQVPYHNSGTDRQSWPAGNCIVQDLGHGCFGLYAHMKPGSVKVKAGDHVKRGDIIGYLGNSGNSTGPHLHFHVVDGPDVLASNGVPYVFDRFTTVGEIQLEPFFKNDQAGTPHTINTSANDGEHTNELVREGHVVRF
jgi:hypothetical protein